MQEKKYKICFVAAADITLKFILLSQMKSILREGHEVFAVSSPGKWTKEIEKDGIKVKEIFISRKIFSPISDIASLINLFFYFKKEKFDIVFTFTPKPGLLGQMAAKASGTPVVLNTIFGFYFHENTTYFKRLFFIFIEKFAGLFSDLVFFRNKEDFETAKIEKIIAFKKAVYTGDGIDIEKFNPKKFTEEFIEEEKKKLGIEENKTVIGIVARLVAEKGYMELFSAFYGIISKFPNVLLLVTGAEDIQKKDCISRESAKEFKIDKNIIFLGERPDVDEILSVIDIFVLPSYREGFPHSVMEAMAMAKPIIATDIRGCREAVNNGKTGILVPPKNSEKLETAITSLLLNKGMADQMGKMGREKALREFDERLFFDRMKKEYEKIIFEKDF
jgi:glycosyltransferase involved in cell wall biosynthesis